MKTAALFILTAIILIALLSACSPADMTMTMPMPSAAAQPAVSISPLTGVPIGYGGLVNVNAGAAEEVMLTALASDNEAYVVDKAHAEERHGEGIVEIADVCLEKSGPATKMYNPTTHRTALPCQMENGRFIIKIVEEDGGLVTVFKNKARELCAAVSYLMNAGYQRPLDICAGL